MKESKGSVTRVVNLGHPGAVVEVAENIRVVPADSLVATEQEAAARPVVLLQHPAVGAVVAVLGRQPGHQQQQQVHVGGPRGGQILGAGWGGRSIDYNNCIIKCGILLYFLCWNVFEMLSQNSTVTMSFPDLIFLEVRESKDLVCSCFFAVN